MKISFLVTYYNQKEYVEKSLNSILDIKKPCDWEIVVGDDGSDDGTVDKVLEYVEKYPDNIFLYKMDRKSGVKYDSVKRASANRLNILEHSSGDVFCVLDGDDFYTDRTFAEDAIGIFENNSAVSVVAFEYSYLRGEQLEQLQASFPGYRGLVSKEEYLDSHYIHAGACVIKKAFSNERIDYLKQVGYYDDNNILINALNFGEFYYIGRNIYAYRQSGESIYTSMDKLEKAVLNSQGFDSDCKMIDDKYRVNLLNRYGQFIYTCFVWRKHLKDILGEQKYNKYLEGCKGIDNSITYQIFVYDTLNKSGRAEVDNVINRIVKSLGKTAVKIKLKYLLRGII